MEADYEGQHSSHEERRSGQYGGPQSYHIVPSPPRAGMGMKNSWPARRQEQTPPHLQKPGSLPGLHNQESLKRSQPNRQGPLHQLHQEDCLLTSKGPEDAETVDA